MPKRGAKITRRIKEGIKERKCINPTFPFHK
jgi:hypothetical protein